MEGKLLAYENINLSVNENDKIQAKVGLVSHRSNNILTRVGLFVYYSMFND
jgi:hypothetical protein